MKAGEKDRLSVIRMLLAAVKQVEVDKRIELDDGATLAVIEKMVKQRRDSVSQFRAGARDDLADKEQSEIEILQGYLPEPLSAAELDSLIEQAIAATGASGIRDMGKVMASIKERAAGRADMGQVSGRVKAKLS